MENKNNNKIWSISFAYRLGLGFHALNNEGSDGSNLMQPRRIDVGKITYDGISGEIIRHHILEYFVRICDREGIAMLPLSAALHPDRGPLGIRAGAKLNKSDESLSSTNLHQSVRKSIEACAVIDVGGFLAAYQKNTPPKYIAERSYIDSKCAELDNTNFPQPVKRESCFDVAWLISQEPQDYTVTQHSSFRDTASLNDRYAQTMRSNIYGGVIRADIFRVGTDDHWYLQDTNRLAITPEVQAKRQIALIEAIINFIAAPTGAKVAAWAPHVFLTDGAIVLSSVRTAPFVSPVKVSVSDLEKPVQYNESFKTEMENFNNNTDTWTWTFKDGKELLDAFGKIKQKINVEKE